MYNIICTRANNFTAELNEINKDECIDEYFILLHNRYTLYRSITKYVPLCNLKKKKVRRRYLPLKQNSNEK